MSKRHDDSLATILLVSRLCSPTVKPLGVSEYWRLRDVVVDGPGALLGQSENEVKRAFDLPADLAGRIAALLGRAMAMALELDRLAHAGIETLTVLDDHYPRLWRERLRRKAPPVLHAAGASELLDTPGVGVVGSRDVSDLGGEVAKEVALHVAQRCLPLVSGGARGVDQLAMNRAFIAGGCVVGILAESLVAKLKRPEVRRAIHEGRTLVCTPYGPDTPFRAGFAMGRDKLIYAQSSLTVVVASAVDSGGTWAGATEAMRRSYGRVAVWRGPGEGPGNEHLEKHGAAPVRNIADIDALLDGDEADSGPAVGCSDEPTAPAAVQMQLPTLA